MNYQEYKKQEQSNGSEQVKTQFMGNLLKGDGSSVVVRFPYKSPDDFDIVTAHELVLPGNIYPQRVECTMEENGECILCAKKEKKVNRFLVKAIAYIINNNTHTVDLVPVVWDKPTKYADELAEKIKDYGDLSDHLFKIKRNGVKTETTYSTDIVLNKAVYKDDIYVKDFSLIEKLNPKFLLIRRMSKYLELTKDNQLQDVEDKQETSTITANISPTTPTSAPVREYKSDSIPNTNTTPTPNVEARTVQNLGARVDPTERRPIKRFTNIK